MKKANESIQEEFAAAKIEEVRDASRLVGLSARRDLILRSWTRSATSGQQRRHEGRSEALVVTGGGRKRAPARGESRAKDACEDHFPSAKLLAGSLRVSGSLHRTR